MPLRLLFLSKRHPQQRDLVDRPYGRFHYLPVALAALGHEVCVQLCSHNGMDSVESEHFGVVRASDDLRALGVRRFLGRVDDRAEAFRPDWVIGCSDTWLGWLAQRVARRSGARLAIDAYDNYEAYMPWNVPLHHAWRRAVRAADLVTAAGPQLAARLQRHCLGGRNVEVLPMAADPNFVTMDRGSCRDALELPDSSPLIGYFGGWAPNRGTDVLIESFRRVLAIRPDARLVLSGHPPADIRQVPGVIALGYLLDAQLPILINAMNVACVITADTSFGRYSYPAKLCEAMSCGIPVVATATDPVRWMLSGRSQFLAPVNDPTEIAYRLLANLGIERVDYGLLPTWQQCGERLDALLSA